MFSGEKNENIYNNLVNVSNEEVVIVGNMSSLQREADEKFLKLNSNESNKLDGCIDDLVRYKNDNSFQHWRTRIFPSNTQTGVGDWEINSEDQLSSKPIGILEGINTFESWKYSFSETSFMNLLNDYDSSKEIIEREISDMKENGTLLGIESKFKELNSQLIILNHG